MEVPNDTALSEVFSLAFVALHTNLSATSSVIPAVKVVRVGDEGQVGSCPLSNPNYYVWSPSVPSAFPFSPVRNVILISILFFTMT